MNVCLPLQPIRLDVASARESPHDHVFRATTALSVGDQLNQHRGGSIGLGISFPLFDG